MTEQQIDGMVQKINETNYYLTVYCRELVPVLISEVQRLRSSLKVILERDCLRNKSLWDLSDDFSWLKAHCRQALELPLREEA